MSNHNFRSSHVFRDTEDESKESLIDSFNWGDDSSESEVSQPEHETVSKFISCVESLSNYFVKNITVESFRYDCEDVLSISLSIPVETNHLLSDRFDTQWSEYSRNQVFQGIQIFFDSYWNEEARLGLSTKLDGIVPPPKNKKHRVCEVKLWDGLGSSDKDIWIEASVVYVEEDNA